MLPIAISLYILLRRGIFQLNASCRIPEEPRVFNSLQLKQENRKKKKKDGKNKMFCPNAVS